MKVLVYQIGQLGDTIVSVPALREGPVVPADSRALAGAIERILSVPGLADGLSRRGVLLVRLRYQSDAVAAQVMQLYAEIGGRS